MSVWSDVALLAYLKLGKVHFLFVLFVQVILACDDSGTPGDERDDRCLTIFDFFQLQWTFNFWSSSSQRSGFNDGHGSCQNLFLSLKYLFLSGSFFRIFLKVFW